MCVHAISRSEEGLKVRGQKARNVERRPKRSASQFVEDQVKLHDIPLLCDGPEKFVLRISEPRRCGSVDFCLGKGDPSDHARTSDSAERRMVEPGTEIRSN